MALKMKSKKSPLGSRSRRVLLMGDEGAALYTIMGKKSERRVSLPWSAPDFEEKFIEALSKDGKGNVIILFDGVEQYYRKDVLPKVSVMDKAKVLKRKLGMVPLIFSKMH